MVNSRFHCIKQGSFVGSTLQLLLAKSLPQYALYIYLSIPLINTRQVDLRCEGYFRGNVWIVRAAVDLEAVDAILVNALREVRIAKTPDHSNNIREEVPG